MISSAEGYWKAMRYPISVSAVAGGCVVVGWFRLAGGLFTGRRILHGVVRVVLLGILEVVLLEIGRGRGVCVLVGLDGVVAGGLGVEDVLGGLRDDVLHLVSQRREGGEDAASGGAVRARIAAAEGFAVAFGGAGESFVGVGENRRDPRQVDIGHRPESEEIS